MKPSKFALIFLVACGSAVGGLLRYLISIGLNPFAELFPWATFAVNLLGSFLIGVLFVWCARFQAEQKLRALLIVGLMGGLTTFSSFSLEADGLIHTGRAGLALLYVFLSVVLGILGVFLGMSLMRLRGRKIK